ncbi:response regulator [Candidatus Nitrosopumilus sp. SW]|uniref:response regulator n=1 Tax=Candidatus Nitrosopumilus sp. SW TaxID=2508726 RepID=UPI0011538039|nr:response regulator [Candidatus Nitrosopumilus sp. SW]QDI88141.1 response regulator [Candidatus Nitrosopumilus sp. SW]
MAKKVLIVDDTISILDMLKDSLTSEGYEVETVNNSTKGLEMIKTDAYDIVLLDIQMPEMTGLEIISSLKDTSIIHTTKIVLMTASEIPSEDLTNLMKVGVAAWIRKPINLEILSGRLKTL